MVQARKGARITDEDAKVISAYIEKKYPGGEVTAEQVLDLARPKRSPIHKYFDWNDSVAAEKWRLHQARMIMCSIVIEKTDDVEVRKYHNVYIEQESQTKWVELDKARNAPELWQQVLKKALFEAKQWQRRYDTYKELKPVFKEKTAKKTTKKLAKKASTKATKEEKSLKIPEINFGYATITLIGETPLIVNRFSEKSKAQMEEGQTGGAKGKKPFRVIEEEYKNSLYKIPGGRGAKKYGIPAGGIRNCAVSACTFIDGVAKTTARGSFQIMAEGGDLIPIKSKKGPVMDESIVRVGPWSNKSAMTRYRGRFDDWEVTFTVKYNQNVISAEQLLNLFENAGFAIGLCEWRPEKNGSKGMFKVKRS